MFGHRLPQQPPSTLRRSRRGGHSLLELVAASFVITIALVPALRLMRDSLKAGRNAETAILMSTLCASKLEEQLALSAADWQPIQTNGDYAADGYPSLRFQVQKSDSLADGGIAGSLMSIVATVWHDRNGDSAWSADEPRVVYASKLARMASYASEANGT